MYSGFQDLYKTKVFLKTSHVHWQNNTHTHDFLFLKTTVQSKTLSVIHLAKFSIIIDRMSVPRMCS